MDYKQVQELLKAVNKSNINELSIKDGDFEITIKQQTGTEVQYLAVQSGPMQPQAIASQIQPQSIAAPQHLPVAPQESNTNTDNAISSNTITIKSPMIGTFYRSASPDKPVFVNVGDEIKQGQVLCIVEAMKLFNEIESEVSGKIVKVLVDDASPVEYDQPLFLVEP